MGTSDLSTLSNMIGETVSVTDPDISKTFPAKIDNIRNSPMNGEERKVFSVDSKQEYAHGV